MTTQIQFGFHDVYLDLFQPVNSIDFVAMQEQNSWLCCEIAIAFGMRTSASSRTVNQNNLVHFQTSSLGCHFYKSKGGKDNFFVTSIHCNLNFELTKSPTF